MKCSNVKQRLDDFIDGLLGAIEQEAIVQHLLDCKACSDELAISQHLLLELRSIPVPEPRKGYEDRVFDFLHTRELPSRQHYPRWFATGFATAAIAFVALWLLFVPGSVQQDENQSIVTIQLAPQQVRKISLVFNSPIQIKQAILSLELPDNIELAGYANRRSLEWKTDLKAGTNRLTLPLIARGNSSGIIRASITHADKTRAFQIQVKTIPSSTQRSVNIPLTT